MVRVYVSNRVYSKYRLELYVNNTLKSKNRSEEASIRVCLANKFTVNTDFLGIIFIYIYISNLPAYIYILM